jgi:hypothetical protein
MMKTWIKTATVAGTAVFLAGTSVFLAGAPAIAQHPGNALSSAQAPVHTVTFRDGAEFFDFGDIRVQMVRDTRMNIPLMRLTAFPGAERMNRINWFLEDLHKQEIARVKECLGNLPPRGPYRNGDNSVPMDVSVSFVTEKAMSYTISSSWYCGGNRPNVEIRPVIVDLESLTVLDTAPCPKQDTACAAQTGGLGRLVDLSTPDKRNAFNTMWWTQWTSNAEQLAALSTEAEPLAEECIQRFNANPEIELDEAGFALHTKGLLVTRLNHPAPATHCVGQPFNSVVIPWSVLKPYLASGQTTLTNADLVR